MKKAKRYLEEYQIQQLLQTILPKAKPHQKVIKIIGGNGGWIEKAGSETMRIDLNRVQLSYLMGGGYLRCVSEGPFDVDGGQCEAYAFTEVAEARLMKESDTVEDVQKVEPAKEPTRDPSHKAHSWRWKIRGGIIGEKLFWSRIEAMESYVCRFMYEEAVTLMEEKNITQPRVIPSDIVRLLWRRRRRTGEIALVGSDEVR